MGSDEQAGGKSLDERRFEEEAHRNREELDLKRREFQLKQDELAFRLSGAGRAGRIRVSTAVVAAAAAILAAVFAAYLQGRASIQLEREKFRSSLILRAIGTDNQDEAGRNLRFFVKAGLISDPDGRIASLRPSEVPVLPSPMQSPLRRIDFRVTWAKQVVDLSVLHGDAASLAKPAGAGIRIGASVIDFARETVRFTVVEIGAPGRSRELVLNAGERGTVRDFPELGEIDIELLRVVGPGDNS
jgi:hypothetical protein